MGALVGFSIFVQMAAGATFSVVPFINKRALGAVAGIVGAGGNAGAVAAGFLFKTESLTWPQALFILGCVVAASSMLALVVRFSEGDERAVRHEIETRLAGSFLASAKL
jgi:NNP family nitrate/nitrite transporter-like MFS transporter